MTVDVGALAAALSEPQKQFGTYGLRCYTCRLLAEIAADSSEQAQFVRDMIAGGMPADDVATRLQKVGVGIGPNGLRRHRNGLCKTRAML